MKYTTVGATANNHQNSSISTALSSTTPLNHTYHNSLRKMKNDERCFFRNNSLKRSFKRINNESPSFFTPHIQQMPHHCTIELKTKATSCLHLFHKNSPPVILTTFKNQKDMNDPNDQPKNNEILWRYHLSKCDLNRKIASSHCNLNNLCHNYHHFYHQQKQQQQTQQPTHNNSNSVEIFSSSANETPTIIETKFQAIDNI